jgi:GNAT superfamily N-acetyltransferase
VSEYAPVTIRAAGMTDFDAIRAIAIATGQKIDLDDSFPGYVRHLIDHGTFLVAVRGDAVTGYGAALPIGAGARAVSMLTDLFIDPHDQGAGIGRAILTELWTDEPHRMTFSSLNTRALPLYASFGLDAWWPLLYLTGPVARLSPQAGWSVSAVGAAEAAALEQDWTGRDRTADYQLLTSRPSGTGVVASLNGRPMAAGTAGITGSELTLSHLTTDPAATEPQAAQALLAVLSRLEPASGHVRTYLPGPHPAVRPLLAAGWKISEFDLYMASAPELTDPRRSVPAPGLA